MFSHSVNDKIKLKILEPRFAEELYALSDRNRNYLREWLPWVDGTKSSDDTKNFIESSLKQLGENNGFNCAIFYRDQIAGCIGFHNMDWGNKKASIGYWLAEEFQGEGIMTSACKNLISHAFTELKLNRIEIRAGVYNLKSRAIPERLGFTNEGTVRQVEWIYDRYIDHVIYGMLSSDWKIREAKS
jgi:ribosomal-protein-serine acetyltransferase